ncbi:2,5-diketo-D-gluconic acid reductase [Suicoccus acidiformans]|uniref:2,5-diketo-D-gluconic acid reductase n=1 Tax=Suicoccus acidiformans TaxID=2036206 RepID=A0A347WNH1_9LACT|nr:aldo/keto reductase [Suicoccus acidiformans]AXY26628.1 2,5-diketo-D-gluconic acid reductase [Suicoccus acidiformans]
MLNNYFTLNNGSTVPAIGFGTVGIKGAKGVTTILSALNYGYRLIDTSTNYNNEGMVGEALRRTSIPREEIQITSKLPGANHQYDDAINAIQESLYRIGIDYFDHYLIHWPLPKQGQYVEAWQALVDAQKWGLIKNIGVSNFYPEHLDRIIDATGIVPQINQIERHPYFNHNEVVQANQDLGILVQSWSSFGREINDVLTNDVIKAIADKYEKTPAQIILRWNLDRGVMPVAKASSPKHQQSNLNILDFRLSFEDIERINQLDKGESGRVEGQHPNEYEEFD